MAFSLGSEGEPVEGLFSVARVTFANPETGYAVVQLVSDDSERAQPVAATGIFGTVQEGTCYRVQGNWHHDPRYGAQIRVTSAILEMPASPAAIERYLA